MTTTESASTYGVNRTRPHRALAVLSAIAGRAWWRLWLPLALYLSVAALSWLWLWASGAEQGSYTLLPAVSLLLSLPIWLGVLWLWGARFSLSLGDDRRHLFATMWALSTLGPVAMVWLAGFAHYLEYCWGSLGGLSVWAVDDPGGKMGAEDLLLLNGITMFFIMLAMPVLLALSLGCIGWLCRGLGVALLTGGIAFASAFAGFVMWGAIDNQLLGAHQSATFVGTYAVMWAAATVVGWLMFRRVPA